MSSGNSRRRCAHAPNIRFSILLARNRIRTSYFTSQDDLSNPDSKHELVLWGSLSVETRDLGQVDSLRRSAFADLPVVAVGSMN